MISPHPTTTQMVAEPARRERLQGLAAGRRPARQSLLGRYGGHLMTLIGRVLS